MKKTILIIMMFILSLPLVFAFNLHGGETWVYNFQECNELKVNITATDRIDKGEYKILNNCTKNDTNYYFCDCENDYNFSVKFHPGAVNSYTFNFNYNYSKNVEEQTSGGGGGGGGSHSKLCTESWVCTEWSFCKPNGKTIRNCTDSKNCGTIEDKPFEERSCYHYTKKETTAIVEINKTLPEINQTNETVEIMEVEIQEEEIKDGSSDMLIFIVCLLLMTTFFVLIPFISKRLK